MSDTTATEEEAAPAPEPDALRDGIVDDLRDRIGDALIDSHVAPGDDVWVRVATDSWVDTAEALRSAGFRYFCFLSAIDWLPSPYGNSENLFAPAPESSEDDDTTAEGSAGEGPAIETGVTGGETRMQVFARLTDIDRHVGITIKADVPDDAPAVGSWVGVFAGANWHERECHEMFGITFDGHPDLRNMYLPSDFEGHPLRKDFPLLARMVKPCPGIVDVEAMPDPDEDKPAEVAPAADATTAAEGSASDEAEAAASGDATPAAEGSASDEAEAAASGDATPAAEGSASDEADAARGGSAADDEPAIKDESAADDEPAIKDESAADDEPSIETEQPES